eukprot:329490-Pyramimonas_sp.AAC.1
MTHQVPEFWGCASRECDTAGWEHGLYNHFAQVANLETGTLFSDLSKFYERTSHYHPFQEGEKAKFSIELIWLACTLYGGPRTVTFQNAISDVFHVNGTVLVGCSLAVALAKVLLYDLLASLARSCPAVMIRNVVDDVHVQVVGTR